MESFSADVKCPLTSILKVNYPTKNCEEFHPAYQVIDARGGVVDVANEPEIDQNTAYKILRYMIRLRQMDRIFFDAQRQGQMPFYATSEGEEGLQMGSAAALDEKDMVFGQYREPGILMWRGFPIEKFADQCLSNEGDLGHGRQMSVHYGSKDLFYQTISSVLATQIPQAVGAAYALKTQGLQQISVCYFGEGAASLGDFHAAMNFASTLHCPIVFICRNNGYAISTPSRQQYSGDGIVSRAPGYGMASIRIDGNDPLAVYNATKTAREVALSTNRPVLIEAMTFRVGHHTTSDDWKAYRKVEEVEFFKCEKDPINRFMVYLSNKGILNISDAKLIFEEERKAAISAITAASKKGPPAMTEMFKDVYKFKPKSLQEQEKSMFDHLAKYPENYKSKGC